MVVFRYSNIYEYRIDNALRMRIAHTKCVLRMFKYIFPQNVVLILMENRADYGNSHRRMRLTSKTDVGRIYEKRLLLSCGIEFSGNGCGYADPDIVGSLVMDFQTKTKREPEKTGLLPDCVACAYDVLANAATRGILGDAPKNYDAARYRARAERIRSGKIALPNVPFVPIQYRGKIGNSPY